MRAKLAIYDIFLDMVMSVLKSEHFLKSETHLLCYVLKHLLFCFPRGSIQRALSQKVVPVSLEINFSRGSDAARTGPCKRSSAKVRTSQLG